MLIAFVACKNESAESSQDELTELENAVKNEPNGESISQLLAAYNKVILDKNTGRKELKNTLDKAYKIVHDNNWDKELIGFTSTYLKEFPGDQGNEDKIIRLISAMSNRGQKVTVDALKLSFLEAYPKSVHYDSIKTSLAGSFVASDSLLINLATRVFENPDASGINVQNAREYVNACEACALVLPAKNQTPRYLFNAAEISRTIRTFDKTLYLYDWIIDKYPKFEKAPMALFLKGFILENELNNIDMARDIYRQFIQNYPSHEMADDVQFLLDNLGKSNEEILEMIEKEKQQGE
jgi:tetratricopeptide (TPR) repeat protein